MRLRNIKRAEEIITASELVIINAKEQCGKWKESIGNCTQMHIEIGMGKGRFILEMARKHPEIFYIGIEKYSSVLLRAIERYETEGFEDVKNVRFLCEDARELLEIFAQGEVQKIYLNFSDPWPKERHTKRRLTALPFLKMYEQLLPKGGVVEFKTDNRSLFDFSVQEIQENNWELEAITYDLHNEETLNIGNIMTEYEEKFSAAGNPICKLIAKPIIIV